MQWSGILFQSPILNQNPELRPFKNSKVIKKKKKKNQETNADTT